ncbi:endonuclease domain-containing protein [Francisella philomiragia]
MTKIFNRVSNKSKRQSLRVNQTVAERYLWNYIRRDTLGVRVRRQYGVGKYIVDFYIPKLKVAIEIDGDSHFTEDSRQYDFARESYMNNIGIKTIRYTNNQVMDNIDSVFSDLLERIKELSPNLSLSKREEYQN